MGRHHGDHPSPPPQTLPAVPTYYSLLAMALTLKSPTGHTHSTRSHAACTSSANPNLNPNPKPSPKS